MLILNEQVIKQIYTMKDAIADVNELLVAKANGDILAPHRTVLDIPQREASSLYMPSADLTHEVATVKVVTIFPQNPEQGKATTQGVITLSNMYDGAHLALINASYLTRLRTGAMSAIATSSLAKKDSKVLAVIGTGAMAFEQVLGVLEVRLIETIYLFNRTVAKAEQFAQNIRAIGFAGSILIVDNASDAVKKADIICCATKTHTPLFDGELLQPGVHINGVGSYLPHMHELDVTTITRASKIVVDDLPGVKEEAGELMEAVKNGAWSFDQVHAELDSLVMERVAGRENEDEITFFKSVGAAYYDLAVAHGVYKKACQLKVGVEVEI